MAKHPPEKVFRLGNVSGAVFRNDVGARSYYNVTLQKNYHTGKQWRGTSAYGEADIDCAVTILEQAKQYIEARKRPTPSAPIFTTEEDE